MIYVIDELKLNDFKEVHCIKPRDLFMRYGRREIIPTESNLEEPIPMNMRKLDSIEYLERYDEMMQRDSSRKAGTDADSIGSNNNNDDSSD